MSEGNRGSRISEARGLVQRLFTLLRREDEGVRTSDGSSRSGTDTGTSISVEPSGSGTVATTAGVASVAGRSSSEVTPSPREVHGMLFGYQPSSRSRKRTLPSLNRPGTTKREKKLTPWSHMFVCLASTEAETVPGDYSLLAANGLGKKKIQLYEQSNATDIHAAIIDAFPQLKNVGGYDLLRTIENSKRLTVVVAPLDGYTGAYLKNVLGQAKCFIRPIQHDIEISDTPALMSEDEVLLCTCVIHLYAPYYTYSIGVFGCPSCQM